MSGGMWIDQTPIMRCPKRGDSRGPYSQCIFNEGHKGECFCVRDVRPFFEYIPSRLPAPSLLASVWHEAAQLSGAQGGDLRREEV